MKAVVQGPGGGGGGRFRAVPFFHGLNFILTLGLSFGGFGKIGP